MFRSSLLLFLLLLPFGFNTAQDISTQQVEQSIKRGIDYLKRQQKGNGNFDQRYAIGNTALALVAMRSCGVSPNDPSVQAGIKYLRMFPDKDDGGTIYSLCLATMAFCLVEPEKDFQLIKSNVKKIEARQSRRKSEHSGGWHYTADESSDCSCSQYAILALYEAERAGVKIDQRVWAEALQFWSASQNPDGSWGYTPFKGGSSHPRGSMSCAGIASLVITNGTLQKSGAEVHQRTIVCSIKTQDKYAEQIQRGLDWLAKRFSVGDNPNAGGQYLFYYLYGLERVGRLTNMRFVGNHDWYREGTAKIMQLQDPLDGGWHDNSCPNVSNTAFALLFLSKGRRPVLMSKLEFGDSDSWNIHPNDVNNLTAFAEKQWNQEMTWQTINLSRASADHLLQSPVLFLAGNESHGLLDEGNIEKIRTYLDQGGFLFAEAQPNDKSFDLAFRELMSRVFPEPGNELKLLARNHPVWNAEIMVAPEYVRRIEGIEYGCRTNVVYAVREKMENADRYKPSLSCLWEVAQIFDREKKYPEELQKQIDAGLGIGLNVLAYATNRELKHKDEIAEHIVKEDKQEITERRGKVFVPLLDYGSANPAPHAVPNLLTYLEAELDMSVDMTSERVRLTDEDLADFPVLFMHGKEAFHFTDAQRKGLKKHLENGGFLFANAICSSKSFTESFTNEIKKMFPDLLFEKIPLNDPLYSKDDGGFDVSFLDVRITERTPDRKTTSKVRQTQPDMFGVKTKDTDRWFVIFSPVDVSCALEKAGSMECRGYTQTSALKLSANVILYALEHW